MKTLNIPLEDEEHEKLSEEKGDLTWREFLIKIANSGVWLKGTVESEPRNSWGKEWTFDEPLEFDKPCHKCGYCPYGKLVEEFPILEERNEMSCKVFGHQCPAFYAAEPLAEASQEQEKEFWEMFKESGGNIDRESEDFVILLDNDKDMKHDE